MYVSDYAVPYGTASRAVPSPVDALLMAKQGLSYKHFTLISSGLPLSASEWAEYLHLSERTLLRYQKENKSFEQLYAERILQIQFLFQRGAEVFGSKEGFHKWLHLESLALGGARPKDLLSSVFGIQLIEAELGRIEHGVFS